MKFLCMTGQCDVCNHICWIKREKQVHFRAKGAGRFDKIHNTKYGIRDRAVGAKHYSSAYQRQISSSYQLRLHLQALNAACIEALFSRRKAVLEQLLFDLNVVITACIDVGIHLQTDAVSSCQVCNSAIPPKPQSKCFGSTL